MTTFARSPKTLRRASMFLDPDNRRLNFFITLQFNKENLQCWFQIQSLAAVSGGRSEALQLSGPPVETIKLDAEIDKVN